MYSLTLSFILKQTKLKIQYFHTSRSGSKHKLQPTKQEAHVGLLITLSRSVFKCDGICGGRVIPQGRSFLSSQPSVLQWGGHTSKMPRRSCRISCKDQADPGLSVALGRAPTSKGVSANSSTSPMGPGFSPAKGDALGRGGTTSDMRLKRGVSFPCFLQKFISTSTTASETQQDNETADGVQE